MDDVDFAIMTIFMLIAIVFSTIAAICATEGSWQREAIAHHAAHYDATTGKFTWNEGK